MSGMLDESWQQHIASSVAHWSEMAKAAIDSAAAQYERPSAVFKPRLSVDGNQWCALYGDNLQDGVAGFGDSPADAMWDFDRNWGAKMPAQKPDSRRAQGRRATAPQECRAHCGDSACAPGVRARGAGAGGEVAAPREPQAWPCALTQK